MQKSFVLILLVIGSIGSTAQVGINTTDPKAQLDIKASNSAAPLPTDGILVPKIEDFPATSPGVDQGHQGAGREPLQADLPHHA